MKDEVIERKLTQVGSWIWGYRGKDKEGCYVCKADP
jgi:hypothetical protein